MTYYVARLLAAFLGLLIFVGLGFAVAFLRGRLHVHEKCHRFRSHPAAWSLVILSGSMGVIVLIGMLSQGVEDIWVPALMILGAVWLASVIARDVAVDEVFVYQGIGARRLAAIPKSSIHGVRKAVFGAVLRGESGSIYVHVFLMRKHRLVDGLRGAPSHVVASLCELLRIPNTPGDG